MTIQAVLDMCNVASQCCVQHQLSCNSLLHWNCTRMVYGQELYSIKAKHYILKYSTTWNGHRNMKHIESAEVSFNWASCWIYFSFMALASCLMFGVQWWYLVLNLRPTSSEPQVNITILTWVLTAHTMCWLWCIEVAWVVMSLWHWLWIVELRCQQ